MCIVWAGEHLHIASQPERDEQVALQRNFRLHTARKLDGKLDAQCSRGGADGRLPRATQHTRQQSVSRQQVFRASRQCVAASSDLAALEVNRAENIAKQPRVCAGAREARGVVAHPLWPPEGGRAAPAAAPNAALNFVFQISQRYARNSLLHSSEQHVRSAPLESAQQ